MRNCVANGSIRRWLACQPQFSTIALSLVPSSARSSAVRSSAPRTKIRATIPVGCGAARSLSVSSGAAGTGGGSCFSSRTGSVCVQPGLGRPMKSTARTR